MERTIKMSSSKNIIKRAEERTDPYVEEADSITEKKKG
jgi:hypothetical protein